MERAKIMLQQERLELVREGRLSGVSLLWEVDPDLPRGCALGRAPDSFDIVGNIWLLPRFFEKDPEVLFVV